MSGQAIVVRAVKLAPAERGMKRSPWRSINRANSLQWFVIALAPFVPVIYLVATLRPSTLQALIAVMLAQLSVVAAMLLCKNLLTTITREMDSTPIGAEGDDWRLESDTIRLESSSRQSSFPWRALVDVQETPSVFHFVLTPMQVFVLPKRCLNAAEIDLLREFVKSARERGDLKGASTGA